MDRYQARDIVAMNSDLSLGARALYNLLDNHQRAGESCWPRQCRLASVLACTPRSVQRYLAELVRSGYCQVERDSNAGRNVYVLFHTTQVSIGHDSPVAYHTTAVSLYKPNLEVNTKPPTPFGEEPKQKPNCPTCGDFGYYHRDGRKQRCEACKGGWRKRA